MRPHLLKKASGHMGLEHGIDRLRLDPCPRFKLDSRVCCYMSVPAPDRGLASAIAEGGLGEARDGRTCISTPAPINTVFLGEMLARVVFIVTTQTMHGDFYVISQWESRPVSRRK